MFALLLVAAAAGSAAQDATFGLGLQGASPTALSAQLQLPGDHAVELAVRPPLEGRVLGGWTPFDEHEGSGGMTWLRLRWLHSPGALVEIPGARGAELRWYGGAGLLCWTWPGGETIWGAVQLPIGLSLEPSAVPLQLWFDLDLRLNAALASTPELGVAIGGSWGARWFF